MFGNTEQIANAVASGLRDEGYDATAVDVRLAVLTSPEDADLLVVGAPTHAFSLSRRSTRHDAVRQGAPPERARTGIREWLGILPAPSKGAPPPVAIFDTRVAKARRLPSAGRGIMRLARRHGSRVIGDVQGFLVEDVRGPLLDGELQRARDWGRRLASLASR